MKLLKKIANFIFRLLIDPIYIVPRSIYENRIQKIKDKYKTDVDRIKETLSDSIDEAYYQGMIVIKANPDLLNYYRQKNPELMEQALNHIGERSCQNKPEKA